MHFVIVVCESVENVTAEWTLASFVQWNLSELGGMGPVVVHNLEMSVTEKHDCIYILCRQVYLTHVIRMT